MNTNLLRTDKDSFTEIYHQYVDTVYRICFSFLKNEADTKDAVQDVFIKLLNSNKIFESSDHIKAWLIVTASNHCKNIVSHWWWKRQNYDDISNIKEENNEDIGLLDMVLSLPEKYKMTVYLYYYEGYDSREIGKMLGKPDSTIRTYLQKARKMLKEELE